MSRTTIALAPPLLKKLKEMSGKEDVTLRQLVGDLLLLGLEAKRQRRRKTPAWTWKTHPMGAKIDITDKDALYAILDRDELAR